MTNLQLSVTAALLLAGFAALGQQSEPKMLRKFDAVKALPSTVNTEDEEGYPVLSPKKDVLYFVRTYKDKTDKHKRGEQDIFFSKLESGKWGEASNSLPKVNNKFNNAVIGVSKEGDKLYVLNQYPVEDYLTAKGFSKSSKDGDVWSKPKTIVMPKINFKGDHYGAYITPDENLMIVTLNTDGTTGEEDLYVTRKDDMGRWGELVNLGKTVNTGRAEFAPFLSDDKKTLYFSSYGHKGLGDADVFEVKRLDESWTKWSEPENLGEPVNSKGFDAYFNVAKDGVAYFSSKRGGKVLSDIYSTKMFFEPIPEPKPEPIPVDSDAVEVENLKKKFESLSLIYFKFDKKDIQEGDVPILEAVIDVMNRRPKISVTLKGHTDNIGSDTYNLKLSDKRVTEAKKYLMKKGIASERITLETFGENRPTADNKTDKGRADNRRVEIQVNVTK